MKKLLTNMLIIFILTIVILLSYAFIQKRISSLHPGDIYHFLTGKRRFNQDAKEHKKGKSSEKDSASRGAIWLTYMEFKAFSHSVQNNDKESFTKFYQHVLDRCRKLHINRIIVQVRPFGDALYESDYFPWSSCISGKQGESPGYDPLKIMTELTHENGMEIEAWINPYRVSSEDDIKELAESNPARKWAEEKPEARNVLRYDHALYYNPASKQVRALIFNGVEEIVSNYNVDGIHMDDYFYPVFSKDNYASVFDADEYKSQIADGKISQSMSLADWRRYNVNQLVSGIYKRIKKIDPSVSFGISPAGDPDMLRSDLGYYADIDTWLSSKGYIDYIMPQIYWGYTNTEAPFDDILSQWKKLCENSSADLYAGLQLYRLGLTDKSQSDYSELQTSDMIKKQLNQVTGDSEVKGFCLFSFQYLDLGNKTYPFDSTEYSDKRKKILKDIGDYLESEFVD